MPNKYHYIVFLSVDQSEANRLAYSLTKRKPDDRCYSALNFSQLVKQSFNYEMNYSDKTLVFCNIAHFIEAFEVERWVEYFVVTANLNKLFDCSDDEYKKNFIVKLEDILAIIEGIPHKNHSSASIRFVFTVDDAEYMLCPEEQAIIFSLIPFNFSFYTANLAGDQVVHYLSSGGSERLTLEILTNELTEVARQETSEAAAPMVWAEQDKFHIFLFDQEQGVANFISQKLQLSDNSCVFSRCSLDDKFFTYSEELPDLFIFTGSFDEITKNIEKFSVTLKKIKRRFPCQEEFNQKLIFIFRVKDGEKILEPYICMVLGEIQKHRSEFIFFYVIDQNNLVYFYHDYLPEEIFSVERFKDERFFDHLVGDWVETSPEECASLYTPEQSTVDYLPELLRIKRRAIVDARGPTAPSMVRFVVAGKQKLAAEMEGSPVSDEENLVRVLGQGLLSYRPRQGGDKERNASIICIENATKKIEIATHHAFLCTANTFLAQVFIFCWSLDQKFKMVDFQHHFEETLKWHRDTIKNMTVIFFTVERENISKALPIQVQIQEWFSRTQQACSFYICCNAQNCCELYLLTDNIFQIDMSHFFDLPPIADLQHTLSSDTGHPNGSKKAKTQHVLSHEITVTVGKSGLFPRNAALTADKAAVEPLITELPELS